MFSNRRKSAHCRLFHSMCEHEPSADELETDQNSGKRRVLPIKSDCCVTITIERAESLSMDGLCLARNYWGQLGVVAQQQQTFKKMWKIHYSRRLCHTHRMLQQGNCTMNDIVLIHDLSISDRQPPYPRLGRIQSFMDELKDQAIISYGEGGTNR